MAEKWQMPTFANTKLIRYVLSKKAQFAFQRPDGALLSLAFHPFLALIDSYFCSDLGWYIFRLKALFCAVFVLLATDFWKLTSSSSMTVICAAKSWVYQQPEFDIIYIFKSSWRHEELMCFNDMWAVLEGSKPTSNKKTITI